MNQDFIDEQRNADLLDALADLAYEQDQAMRESDQGDWDGIDNAYKQYEDEYSVPYSIPSKYYPGSQRHVDYLGNEEISKEELYACDHYNERYVLPTHD